MVRKEGSSVHTSAREFAVRRPMRGASLLVTTALLVPACVLPAAEVDPSASGGSGNVGAGGTAGTGTSGGSGGTAGTGTSGGSGGTAGTGASGSGGSPGCMGAAVSEADSGLYYLTLSPTVSALNPFVFMAEISFVPFNSPSGLGMRIDSLIPLSAADRMTPTANEIQITETFPIMADGSFDAPLGSFQIDAEANPISGATVSTSQVALNGRVCSIDDLSCGIATGNITAPITLSLEGTWTLEPMLTPDDIPMPPTLNCDGDLADPL